MIKEQACRPCFAGVSVFVCLDLSNSLVHVFITKYIILQVCEIREAFVRVSDG